MSSLVIRNGLIVSMDSGRSVFRGDILIEGNEIKGTGKVKESADEEIDASGKIVIPGLINTHTHVAMAHLKGKLDDMPLEEFLERTFKLDAERSEKGLYNSSLLGMYEMISAGITSFHDLYYSEDVIARAAEEAGMRAFLAWNTLDSQYTTQKGDPVSNAESFIRDGNSDLVSRSIGVQGIYVASDETYARAKEVAERYDVTMHTHLAETRKEVYDFVREQGHRPIEHLAQIGFLSDRLIAAHCVWATLREVKLLATSGVSVSWNPTSNSKLGVGGIPPVPEMLDNSVIVTLGTDSNGSNNSLNLLQEAKYGSISVKNQRWDASYLSAMKMLEMCTVDAAAALRRKDLGSIEAGKKADIVLIDDRMPNMFSTPETAVNNVIYSSNPSNVSDVIINGRIVKKNGSVSGFDHSSFQDCEFV